MDGSSFGYKLRKVPLKRWWKDDRIWYEEVLEDVLGAKEPQIVTRKTG